MKSAIRRLTAQSQKASTPPVKMVGSQGVRGSSIFDLGAGVASVQSQLRTYGSSGTVYSIVSLLAQSSAQQHWHLYKKQPQDGRRRYSKGGTDQGSDMRVEVVQHAAISLWNSPNTWMSGFEFREAAQQHLELTGQTFWVVDYGATTFPLSMWIVRPDRIQPVPDPDSYLAGWVYTAPDGTQQPLKVNEVIQERLPDPEDVYGGLGPIKSIMPNISQQRYATEYQRNLFLNGADPGAIITVPGTLTEQQFDEFVDRWRETHRGVARAGTIAVLTNEASYAAPAGTSNKDLEYGNLRLANRDEIREAYRIHKAMLGTADDVNRANAETADEVFVAWQVIPRLERRRETLNSKLLPLFGSSGEGVEFDFDDPSSPNPQLVNEEMAVKANFAKTLIDAGLDPEEVLDAAGLPAMKYVGLSTVGISASPPEQPEAVTPDDLSDGIPDATARAVARLLAKKQDTAAAVYQQQAKDYPAGAMAWMHHADWKGPVKVPLGHINPDMTAMSEPDPDHVQEFVSALQDGKKVKPVILVKTPGKKKLKLVDGHHRYLAYGELGKPVKAYIGTVDEDHGPWDDMHEHQFTGNSGGGMSDELAILLTSTLRPYTARALPAAAMNRRR